MTQRVSSAGLGFLASEEGLIGLKNGLYYIYNDYKGFPTIGIGHLVKATDDFSKGLTKEGVFALFRKDVERFEQAIDQGITVPLTDHQRSAMLSFLFNEGASRANQEYSTPTRLLNLKRYDLWPSAILVYDKSGGAFDANLLARRKREGAWFKMPDRTPNNDAVLTDEQKNEIMHSVAQSIWDNLPNA
jgi:GH24 family phage-related lysozyme (muramidase)